MSRSLFSMKLTISKLQREKDQSDKTLLAREKSLQRLEKWLQEEIIRNQKATSVAYEVNRKLESALEVAADHIKALEEITIPGLVAANDVFVKRWESESSVFVMRNTAAKMSGKESEAL